jgi:hypothetical protein
MTSGTFLFIGQRVKQRTPTMREGLGVLVDNGIERLSLALAKGCSLRLPPSILRFSETILGTPKQASARKQEDKITQNKEKGKKARTSEVISLHP